MALLPVMKDGLPLMKLDGEGKLVPAMAEDACDCCDVAQACGNCTGETLPEYVTLNVAGMIPGWDFFRACPDCPELNGSYTVPNVGLPDQVVCTWRDTFSVNICTGRDFRYTQVFVSVAVYFNTVEASLQLIGAESFSVINQGPSCLDAMTSLSNNPSVPNGQYCQHDGVSPWTISL